MNACEDCLTECGCLVAYLMATWFGEFLLVALVCLWNGWY